MRAKSVSNSAMGRSWPWQGAQPGGTRSNAKVRISPTKFSAMDAGGRGDGRSDPDGVERSHAHPDVRTAALFPATGRGRSPARYAAAAARECWGSEAYSG
jgi:hypothetical protein